MIKTIEITNIEELFAIKHILGRNFIYRGHAFSDWTLSSALERIVDVKSDQLILQKELMALSSFKNRSKNYLTHHPAEYDFFEWMTLIQHHGGATRLLDFTFSFYISLFFAIDDFNDLIEEQKKIQPCIWCINYKNLKKGLPNDLIEDLDKKNTLFSFEFAEKILFNSFMLELAKKDKIPNLIFATPHQNDSNEKFIYNNKYSYVLPIVPNNQFPRLAAQRGLFLVPLNITETFMNCLFNNFKIINNQTQNISMDYVKQNFAEIQNENILKISISNDKVFIKDILRNLRDMNMTAEYLFPGIDGLAKSSRFSYIINQ